MDTLIQEFPNSMNGFRFDHNLLIPFSANRNLHNGYRLNSNPNPNPNPSFHHSTNSQSHLDDLSSSSDNQSSWPSPEGDNPNSNALLKYISDMLMEEDLEGKNCMLQDCLALQSAEKSFYDVLGQEYPQSSSNHFQFCLNQNSDQNPDENSINSADLLKFSPVSTLLGPGELYPLRETDLQGRKNNQREQSDSGEEERRSSKQSAISLADSENSDMFDDVLLCQAKGKEIVSSSLQENSQIEQKRGSNGRSTRGKKQGKKGGIVDLSTILTQCAQAVSISDQRTATELIKQIRQHSSASGDGNQRLAHYFANALETRLAGIRLPTYSPIISNRTSAADILKAYQVYIQACPFRKMSNFFANRTILKLAEKASSLHIIDFGVLYGFQWPCLIQRLSERPGGPTKLRITVIELPQPGFRPSERVEETARRLKRYCERFNVPFDYNVIAQKWETISYQDLNIDRNEMTVVNSLYRLKNLPDDSVVVDSARDKVLKLIRSIKPDIFIEGVVNGTYDAPFFLTRFREALFHFSSLFDMFDVNLAREDEHRVMFEKEVFAKEAINVIACEGTERIERPETYKQWQARNLRAGFRQLPLDQEILKKVRSTVKSEYHKDFVVDQDGHWMLQGWKGRIIYALSVWKPAAH